MQDEVNKLVNYHFKVVMGMMVYGKIDPPIANAKVSVQRMNRVALKDRIAKIVYTDQDGKFKDGPYEIDDFEVIVLKEGY